MSLKLAPLLLTLLAGMACAQTSVPHVFIAGAPASAEEVNANFSILAKAIDSVATRVSKMDAPATMASLAGTYAYNSLVVTLRTGVANQDAQVASTVLSGTLTFEANGGGSLNATNPGNYIYFNLPGGGADVHDGGGPIVTNLRWSLAGSRLTVLQMTCDVVSSGQLIVCSKRDSLEEGHTRIVLLSRSN